METGISVNKYIYSILSQDKILNGLVENKVFPLIAEIDTTFPFIIFRKDNITTIYTKDGRVSDQVEFSIAIAANNYFDTVTICERVRELFEMKRNQYFKKIHFIGINEDYIDNAYIQEIRFSALI